MELIGKKKFVNTILDKNSKIFVVHVATLKSTKKVEMSIYLFHVVQVATLQLNKALTKILAKYTNYADIFLCNLAMELPKNMGINKHVIELINEKQPSYKPIYALNLMVLETLKTYIEIHLKTEFIWLSKSFIGIPSFWIKSVMVVSVYVLIIEVSITWLLKIGTHYLWLTNP